MTFRVSGVIRVPGDKSISHRALMLSAIAAGRSRIRSILDSADIQSTAGILRAWGIQVPRLSDDFVLAGVGRRGLKAPTRDLDCGNSGTSARLLAGIAAAQPFESRFVGDASLSRRPMRRIARPLGEMGAAVTLPDHGGLPMAIRGGELRSIDYFSETSSAQVKSAVLLAGVTSGISLSVTEPLPSRDHTERMLRARGARVRVDAGHDGYCISLGECEDLRALDVEVPGDPSSAAFFAGLAALADAGQVVLDHVCVNPGRIGVLGVLDRMGAKIAMGDQHESGGEPIATVTVGPGTLRGTTIGGPEIPSLIDELPLLACVAARAEGRTEVTGAAELRVKESDRISTVVSNLRSIGVAAEELPDGLRVTGSDVPLAGRVVTHGDHRIAMAFAVLAAIPGNAIEIDEPRCVGVSYPSFWDHLRAAVSV